MFGKLKLHFILNLIFDIKIMDNLLNGYSQTEIWILPLSFRWYPNPITDWLLFSLIYSAILALHGLGDSESLLLSLMKAKLKTERFLEPSSTLIVMHFIVIFSLHCVTLLKSIAYSKAKYVPYSYLIQHQFYFTTLGAIWYEIIRIKWNHSNKRDLYFDLFLLWLNLHR